MLKDNIKNRRHELNKTLDDVAKIVGVTRQTIQKYESGVVSNIPSDKIELLAKALETTPAYLMGWEKEKSGTENEKEKRIAESLRKAETGEDDYTIRLMGYGGKGLYQIKLTPEKYKAVAELLRQLDEEHGGK